MLCRVGFAGRVQFCHPYGKCLRSKWCALWHTWPNQNQPHQLKIWVISTLAYLRKPSILSVKIPNKTTLLSRLSIFFHPFFVTLRHHHHQYHHHHPIPFSYLSSSITLLLTLFLVWISTWQVALLDLIFASIAPAKRGKRFEVDDWLWLDFMFQSLKFRRSTWSLHII